MNPTTINAESVCNRLQAMNKKMVDYNIDKMVKNQENSKSDLDDLLRDDDSGMFTILRSEGLK